MFPPSLQKISKAQMLPIGGETEVTFMYFTHSRLTHTLSFLTNMYINSSSSSTLLSNVNGQHFQLLLYPSGTVCLGTSSQHSSYQSSVISHTTVKCLAITVVILDSNHSFSHSFFQPVSLNVWMHNNTDISV